MLPACEARFRSELRWVGQLTPLANAAECPASRGVLLLREGQVTFAPDEGTWVLTGAAKPGTLEASEARLTPDHKNYETKLEARWSETEVSGTYRTPRCSYKVSLTRQ